MDKKSLLLLVFLYFLSSWSGLSAQSQTGQPSTAGGSAGAGRSLVLFALAAGQQDIPEDELASLNSRLQEAVFSLPGWDFVFQPQTFQAPDERLFLRSLEKGEWVPDSSGGYAFGKTVFTGEVLRQILSRQIGIIPLFHSFEVLESEEDWSLSLEVEFIFFELDGARELSRIVRDIQSRGSSREEVLEDAFVRLGYALTEGVLGISGFQEKIMISEILFSDMVVIGAGKAQGLKAGDELLVYAGDGADPAGESIGLVIISRTEKNFSYARLIRASRPLAEGDVLHKIPRLGLQAMVYYNYLFLWEGGGISIPGIRLSLSRGFFKYRPLLGLEVPVNSRIKDSEVVPLSIHAGCKINWYFRRFLIQPALYFGLTFLIPRSDAADSGLSHLGGGVDLKASYAVNNTIRIFAGLGWSIWYSPREQDSGETSWLTGNYGGLSLGGGVGLKF